MKFINYLTSIAGIGIYPLISLLVFVLFFVFLTLYVVKADKANLKIAAALPIEEDAQENNVSKEINQ